MMTKIKLTKQQPIPVQTDQGNYMVLTATTSHGSGLGEPFTETIVAIGSPSDGRPAPSDCHLTIDYPYGEARAAWDNGFDITDPKSEPNLVSSRIVTALLKSGNAVVVK